MVCRFVLPPVRHADGFTRYSGAAGTEFAHEAGFDAFMTGAAYAGLLSLTQAANALPPKDDAPEATGDAATAAPVLQTRPVMVCTNLKSLSCSIAALTFPAYWLKYCAGMKGPEI